MKKSISLLLLSLLMIAPRLPKDKRSGERVQHRSQTQSNSPTGRTFELNSKVCLVVPSDAPEVKSIADSLAGQLKLTAGISLKEAESADGKSAICFVVQEGMPKEDINYPLLPVSSRLPLLNRTGSSTAYRHFISYSLRRFTETSWIRKQTGRFLL